MKQVAVMHLIDALDAGGAERMAVNLVNALPRDRYVPYFCTTRRGGALESLISPDVARLALERRHRFDVSSLLHLTRFIRERNIRLLHAHSTSLFIAIAASRLSSRAPVIWHDHYGLHSVEKRSSIIYGPAARRLSGLIAVNQDLAEWSQKKLRVPAEKIWYIPNFAASVEAHGSPPDLPGQEGMRIVCVANMRPQKDHFTLLRALGIVARRMPGVHLLLLGSSTQLNYEQQVRQEVDRLGLAGNVSFLGQRSDTRHSSRRRRWCSQLCQRRLALGAPFDEQP